MLYSTLADCNFHIESTLYIKSYGIWTFYNIFIPLFIIIYILLRFLQLSMLFLC